MTHAAVAGVFPHILMDYTPREVAALFRAQAMKMRAHQRTIIATAWHTAKYQLAGRKFPRNLTGELRAFREPSAPMSNRALRRSLIEAHNRLGGAVRYVPKGSISGK